VFFENFFINKIFSISKNNIICSKAAKLLQHFGPTLILTKVAKEKSKEKSFHIQSSIQSFVHPSGHSFIHPILKNSLHFWPSLDEPQLEAT
jgi:hypothetical protein